MPGKDTVVASTAGDYDNSVAPFGYQVSLLVELLLYMLFLPRGKVRPADKLQLKAAIILPLYGVARSKQDPSGLCRLKSINARVFALFIPNVGKQVSSAQGIVCGWWAGDMGQAVHPVLCWRRQI